MVSEEQKSQQPANAVPAESLVAREAGSTAKARVRAAKGPPPGPPAQSLWPFLLAATLIIAFSGLLFNPIFFAIGLVLAAGSVIGWGLERR